LLHDLSPICKYITRLHHRLASLTGEKTLFEENPHDIEKESRAYHVERPGWRVLEPGDVQPFHQ